MTEIFGKCPICGHEVNKGYKGWYCSNYVNGCYFSLNKNMRRFNDIIKLNDEDVRNLLKGKSIKRTLTSGNGKRYGGYLILEIKNTYVNLKVNNLVKR